MNNRNKKIAYSVILSLLLSVFSLGANATNEILLTTESGNETSYFQLETDSKKGGLVIVDDAVIWSQEKDLNVFSNPEFNGAKIIAPNSKGSYSFKITNAEKFTLNYELNLSDENLNKIPMEYKLRSGNSYLAGSPTSWVKAEEIKNIYGHLNIDGEKELVLDWRWNGEKNDDEDMKIAKNISSNSNIAEYVLKFNVKAEQSGLSEVPDTGVNPEKMQLWLSLFSACVVAVIVIAAAVGSGKLREKRKNER